jgi:hypothetical protein
LFSLTPTALPHLSWRSISRMQHATNAGRLEGGSSSQFPLSKELTLPSTNRT